MSKNYHIEYSDGITRIQLMTRPTFEEGKVIIDDIADNYPYEKRLWDFSNIDFHFTINELHDIAEYGKMRFVKPNRAAFISPNENVDIEMVILDVYRAEAGNADTKVFRKESDAVEWLNS